LQWSMQSVDVSGNDVINNWRLTLTGEDLNRDRTLITGGKALMKYIVNRFDRRMRHLVSSKGDTLLAPDGKKYYPMFRLEGDELVIDNSNTYLNETGHRKRPVVLFGTKLVEAMKWIYEEEALLNTSFEMKGNLRVDSDTVPDDVKKDWAHIDRFRTWSEFWSFTNEGLQLGAYCNWRFSYLDEDYREAFGGEVTTPVFHRTPLYVNSNEGQSMVTGTHVTDLLREVPHDPSLMSYEPAHAIYLPVCTDVLDIIEIELAESDGELVKFVGGGVTTITLHFKHE